MSGKTLMSVGQALQLGGLMVQCLPRDLNSETAQRFIDQPELLRLEIGKLMAAGKNPSSVESHPRIQELLNAGWKIEPGGVSAEGALDISRFELKEFLNSGEEYIVGTTMVDRAKAMGGITGLDSALWLLDHQNKIPKEWRKHYLAFPGAKMRDPDDYLRVPYLAWVGGRWYLRLGWLGGDWRSRFRVVRLCK